MGGIVAYINILWKNEENGEFSQSKPMMQDTQRFGARLVALRFIRDYTCFRFFKEYLSLQCIVAMWRSHIQRVKIGINDNIIEKVTDFKYLGYRISEYGSDLEDKLQTYNKINGAIRRHIGKQMNKERKPRILNITAKAALKFGSEAWVLKK